uniref:hypothetical protein n=1 Tax=Stutzerimonas frequens TaxID=2968969 RepID=UPI00398B70F2
MNQFRRYALQRTHPVFIGKAVVANKPQRRKGDAVGFDFRASDNQPMIHLVHLIEIHEQPNPVHRQIEPNLG